MTNEKKLRQANNEVTIEGILQEVKMEQYSKDGKKWISGQILVQQEEGSVHEISVFANEKTKAGTDNSVYKGLETVMVEYKSIAAVGLEQADRVRVDSAELNTNDYVGRDGKLKSFTKTKANFINRVHAGDEFNPRAEFGVELFITKIVKEMDREGEETGRVKVEGVIPLFNGIVSPQSFIADGEGAEFVESEYEKGQTVQLYGEIINRVEVTKTEREVAFGKPKVSIKEKRTREFLITGGEEAYDEDNINSYDPELIKKALIERETYLEELVEKKKTNGNKPKPKPETKRSGFGKKKEEPSESVDFNEDDLPF